MAAAKAANDAINAAIAGLRPHPFAGTGEKSTALRPDRLVLEPAFKVFGQARERKHNGAADLSRDT